MAMVWTGEGHYAKGFNPPPANFQDPGTIAQLTESFLFWRIAKGGPGLPGESTPWDSAMPVWENILTENEIWQVILYLYQTTGHQPRVMEEGEGGGHKVQGAQGRHGTDTAERSASGVMLRREHPRGMA